MREKQGQTHGEGPSKDFWGASGRRLRRVKPFPRDPAGSGMPNFKTRLQRRGREGRQAGWGTDPTGPARRKKEPKREREGLPESTWDKGLHGIPTWNCASSDTPELRASHGIISAHAPHCAIKVKIEVKNAEKIIPRGFKRIAHCLVWWDSLEPHKSVKIRYDCILLSAGGGNQALGSPNSAWGRAGVALVSISGGFW